MKKSKASNLPAVTQLNQKQSAPKRPHKVALTLTVDAVKRLKDKARANGQTVEERVRYLAERDVKRAAIEQWLAAAPKEWNREEEIMMELPIKFPAWMWLCIATTAAVHGDTIAQAIEQIVDDGFDAGVHGDDEYPKEHWENLRKRGAR
jgi:hypothetical protein